MQRLTLGNTIKNWEPNIANIADRLIMGQQRSVLEKVNQINQMCNLSLGITRTYRWSPGYMDQIKRYMAEDYLEPHMKRKISTYFNQIDNKRWRYENFRDRLNTVENELYDMRRRIATFQNNTELCERVLSKFIDIISKSVDNGCGYYNVYISNANGDGRFNTYEAEMVTFAFYLPDTTLIYYIGKESYPIPIYAATLYYSVPLDDLIYKMSGRLEWIEDDTQPIIDMNASSFNNRFRNGFAFNWKGTYHRKYVNDGTNHRHAQGQLLHPYISSDEFSDRTEYIVDDGEIEDRVGYCCLGQLSNGILRDIMYLKLGDIYAKLLSWHTVFDAVNTQPMNRINTLFWGKHQSMNDTFSNTVPTESANCALNNTNDEGGPKDYCDEIQCLNRDNCNYYGTVQDGGEVADQDGETQWDRDTNTVEEVLPDAQWNPDRIIEAMAENNIHGGEFPDDNPNDNGLGGDINPDEPQDGELTMEEQVIQWAAQRGGAIDLTNNERNQNG